MQSRLSLTLDLPTETSSSVTGLMTGINVDVTRLQSSGNGWCIDRLRGVVGVGRRDLAVFGDTVTHRRQTCVTLRTGLTQRTDLCHRYHTENETLRGQTYVTHKTGLTLRENTHVMSHTEQTYNT